jgi:steroid delta-isomerase-like uncharacterized protein
MGTTRELVTEALRAIDEGRIDDALAVMADDIVFRMPGAQGDSPQDVARIIAVVRRAFPDLRHEVLQCIEYDDRAAFELRISGTHTGPLPTPVGDVPASGVAAVWQSADLITVEDGQITTWRIYYDQVGVLAQIEPALRRMSYEEESQSLAS